MVILMTNGSKLFSIYVSEQEGILILSQNQNQYESLSPIISTPRAKWIIFSVKRLIKALSSVQAVFCLNSGSSLFHLFNATGKKKSTMFSVL
uniref:Uncharacterized protein n=1 Tax=Arundo donax TaxID=35708 RepID=A0A0A9B1V9_ARUDO